MIYVALPYDQPRRASFYLSMEEHIARHFHEDEFFFMWQVAPLALVGRNQLIDTEINLDYCKRHNIDVLRRKSGGGCVYADMGNVMFSYITKDENVNFTFNKYLTTIVRVLNRLGIDAVASGRNDILIDGKKVSGNAFYHVPGRSIVHGTMLYDTNMDHMLGSITPANEKLISKGVQSIRQRIALLKDYTGISLSDFKSAVRETLCDKEQKLTDEDIEAISEIEKEYLSPEFIYGNNPRYTVIRHRRIEGVGEFEVQIELKNDTIKAINMMGDYFLTGDIDNRLLTPLKNVRLNEEAIAAALPDRVDDIIMNLTKKDLIELITKP